MSFIALLCSARTAAEDLLTLFERARLRVNLLEDIEFLFKKKVYVLNYPDTDRDFLTVLSSLQ